MNVNDFVKSLGFDVAKFYKHDGDKDIYIADFDDDEVLTVGQPIFIMVEGDIIRVATDNEAKNILENS